MLSIKLLYLLFCRPLVTSTRCPNLAGLTFSVLELHHYCLKGGVRVRNFEITLSRRSLQLASY